MVRGGRGGQGRPRGWGGVRVVGGQGGQGRRGGAGKGYIIPRVIRALIRRDCQVLKTRHNFKDRCFSVVAPAVTNTAPSRFPPFLRPPACPPPLPPPPPLHLPPQVDRQCC